MDIYQEFIKFPNRTRELARSILERIMRAQVVKHYQQPYQDPIAVIAGEEVVPDFEKTTEMQGWVWCTAQDGRSGWVPKNWLVESEGLWHIDRDYDALELTVVRGEQVEVVFSESGFSWVKKDSGEEGWVPCDHLSNS